MDSKLAARIAARVVDLRDRLVRCLRELIAIPSPTCGEEAVASRVASEMEALGYEQVRQDVLGNVVGTLGDGPLELLYDAQLDTVNVGDVQAWSFDPYLGKVEKGRVYGLGASNSKGAVSAMLHGAHLAREVGALAGVTLHVVGSIMAEECEGLAYRSLLHAGLVDPHVVVLGKCTNLAVCRGHRGRLEGRMEVRGRSAHASAPAGGRNAIHTAASIIARLEELDRSLPEDPFLGQGSIVVTRVASPPGPTYRTAGSCTFHFDRRLTAGESRDQALAQLEALAHGEDVRLEVLTYDRPSYTGQILEVERYYPHWQLPADHPCLRAAVATAAHVLGRPPRVTRWSVSTSGVHTMGVAGIPTLGFGPGREADAHSTHDHVSIDHLVKSVRFYAAYPHRLAECERTEPGSIVPVS